MEIISYRKSLAILLSGLAAVGLGGIRGYDSTSERADHYLRTGHDSVCQQQLGRLARGIADWQQLDKDCQLIFERDSEIDQPVGLNRQEPQVISRQAIAKDMQETTAAQGVTFGCIGWAVALGMIYGVREAYRGRTGINKYT
jgi:hypothetical protein